jgi:hypothetical protein
MANEVLITADELREASRQGLEHQGWASNTEKNEEWLEWFVKRGVRMLKYAAAFGKMYVNIDVPYQPVTEQDQQDLITLRRSLRRMLPGCVIVFIEEEYEGERICVFQIEWSPLPSR